MSAFGFMASSAIIAISLSNAPALANIDGKNLAADAPPHTELINIDWSAENAAPNANDMVVYEENLNLGWRVWTKEFNPSNIGTNPNSGHSLAVTFGAGEWPGMALVASTPLIGAEYRAIAFRVHGGSTPATLSIYSEETEDAGGASPLTYQFTAPANEWRDISIPLSALGNPTLITRINVLYTGNIMPKTVYFDQVRLVANRVAITENTEITVLDTGTINQIDSRMFGTNVPLWMIGREVDANGNRYTPQRLIDRTKSSGISLLRMPGDQWGTNTYGWLNCEAGPSAKYEINGTTYRVPANATACQVFDHARPSDFLRFAKAVNQPVMWTINPSTTAQEAAALVAFFNGRVGDTRSIGKDIKGDDWRNVDHWARLRVARGFNEPLDIKLWEVGNELYNCPPEFWTCDASAYMQGQKGQNTGYWEFVNAMKAIDNGISVGAVGTANLRGDYGRYDGWGQKVIDSARNNNTALDFYSIHVYPYANCDYDADAQRCGNGGQPMSYDALLMQPHAEWSKIQSTLKTAYQPTANASGKPLNIAVTEFNLSGEEVDLSTNMTRTVNALFIADTLGQMITNGYTIAANWALANCTNETTSTDTGMMGEPFGVGANTYARRSHYYVYPLWQRFGHNLLPVQSPLSDATQLSLYGGKTADGKYTLLAINKTGQPIRSTLKVQGPNGAMLTVTGGSVDVLQAASLDNANPTFNGKYDAEIADDLSNVPSIALPAGNSYTFAANSITVLHLDTAQAAKPTPSPTPIVVQVAPTAAPTQAVPAVNAPTATPTPVTTQPIVPTNTPTTQATPTAAVPTNPISPAGAAPQPNTVVLSPQGATAVPSPTPSATLTPTPTTECVSCLSVRSMPNKVYLPMMLK